MFDLLEEFAEKDSEVEQAFGDDRDDAEDGIDEVEDDSDAVEDGSNERLEM